MNPIGQYRPALAAQLFAITGLVLMSEALFLVIRPGFGTGGTQGSVLIQSILGGLYSITYLLILPRYRLFVTVCWHNKALMLFLGLALVSYFWSASPELTSRRLIALLGVTGFGIYLAIQFRPEELFRLLLWTLGVMAMLSLVFVVALPDLGIHKMPHEGNWRGIFGHKNRTGHVFALGVLLFGLAVLKYEKQRWLGWLGLAICGLFVAMSGSRGSWLLTGFMLLILTNLQVFRKLHYSIAVPMAMVGVLILNGVFIWVAADLETATAIIGRDASLSGRTSIWNFLITATDRPWFGYGYSGFWQTATGQYLLRTTTLTRFSGTHAHNGFLDLWIQLGFVGIAAFLATTYICLRRLIRRFIHLDPPDLWITSYFGFYLIGTTSYPIMAHNDIFWALFVTVICYLTKPPVTIETTGRESRPLP